MSRGHVRNNGLLPAILQVSAFRCLKSSHHVSLRPQRHWTDQKIRVHVFYCALASLLCSLQRLQLHRQGIDRSIPALLEDLGQIREAGILTAGEAWRQGGELTLAGWLQYGERRVTQLMGEIWRQIGRSPGARGMTRRLSSGGWIWGHGRRCCERRRRSCGAWRACGGRRDSTSLPGDATCDSRP